MTHFVFLVNIKAMRIICQEIDSPEDRQACQAVRHKVFVEEQKVPAAREVDGLDDLARHFIARFGDRVVATCRVRIMGDAAKIERVAVLKDFRRRGIGQALMKYILQELPGAGDIRLLKLSSQAEAVPFYEQLGFKKHGPGYLDAGIPHFDMSRGL